MPNMNYYHEDDDANDKRVRSALGYNLPDEVQGEQLQGTAILKDWKPSKRAQAAIHSSKTGQEEESLPIKSRQ